ncbi:hypothetical protein KEM54_005825 [Ascosphaera aggregata]|nr:hypothetical protein KEM54_005825 [Ascosphaera aggregata]
MSLSPSNFTRPPFQPICQNCATSTTPLWRRDELGSVLCNACGLFLKLHGRPRPISLKTDVIKSRNRVKTNGVKRKSHPDSSISTSNQQPHSTNRHTTATDITNTAATSSSSRTSINTTTSTTTTTSISKSSSTSSSSSSSSSSAQPRPSNGTRSASGIDFPNGNWNADENRNRSSETWDANRNKPRNRSDNPEYSTQHHHHHPHHPLSSFIPPSHLGNDSTQHKPLLLHRHPVSPCPSDQSMSCTSRPTTPVPEYSPPLQPVQVPIDGLKPSVISSYQRVQEQQQHPHSHKQSDIHNYHPVNLQPLSQSCFDPALTTTAAAATALTAGGNNGTADRTPIELDSRTYGYGLNQGYSQRQHQYRRKECSLSPASPPPPPHPAAPHYQNNNNNNKSPSAVSISSVSKKYIGQTPLISSQQPPFQSLQQEQQAGSLIQSDMIWYERREFFDDRRLSLVLGRRPGGCI